MLFQSLSFQSFFIGGFECSTHRGRRGNRHDLIAATRHDQFALQDFQRLKSVGMTTVREGLRWHLIEAKPERYDFASVLPILHAAQEEKIQILWDLFHYGFPDDVNPFEQSFVYRFAQFAYAFANFLKEETDETPFICPFNEISFFTFAAGEYGFFAPYAMKRGHKLKEICARATIEAIKAVQSVLPQTRFLHIEPVVHIEPPSERSEDKEAAEKYRLAQYEAWDLISGRLKPELGGKPEFLDVIGVNYYWYNQWILGEDPNAPGLRIEIGNPLYRPFNDILLEVWERYRRPIFIAETGAEDDARPHWLRYVCEETRAAMKLGVPVSGICWYPILNHPGWDDDRHCHNGLWDYCDDAGCREIYEPLADELREQQKLFAQWNQNSMGLSQKQKWSVGNF